MTTPEIIIDEDSMQKNEANTEKHEMYTDEENIMPCIKPTLQKPVSERELALIRRLDNTKEEDQDDGDDGDDDDDDGDDDAEQKRERLRNLFKMIYGFFIDCAYFLKNCKGATKSGRNLL
jgi:hypothetical protein